MEFSINHPIIFLIAGLLIAVVLAQSIFFLVKALRRSKQLGMDQKKIRKTITAAAIFTIAPAVAIVISIMMGIWLVPAIGKKLQNGMTNLGKRDAKWADTFQNALFIGMIAAFLGYVFCDVSQLWTADANGLIAKTAEEVVNGQQMDVTRYFPRTTGLVPVCVMAVSALVMVICGLLMRKPKLKWLSEYALPISLILGMAAAIPITAALGQEVVR